MIRVYSDCQITRRKRFHLVADEQDVILWKTRLWSEIIVWLEREGYQEYEHRSEAGNFVVKFNRQAASN